MNASSVNAAEQSERSQRVHRLATGTPVGSPRSLVQLTGVTGVFSHIHLWFTWILTAGAKVMSEQTNIPVNPPPWLDSETDEGFTLVQMTKVPSTDECSSTTAMNIRELRRKMTADKFKMLCHCVLLGLQVNFSAKNFESTIKNVYILYHSYRSLKISVNIKDMRASDYLIKKTDIIT